MSSGDDGIRVDHQRLHIWSVNRAKCPTQSMRTGLSLPNKKLSRAAKPSRAHYLLTVGAGLPQVTIGASGCGRRPRSTLLASNGGGTRVHGAAGGVGSLYQNENKKRTEILCNLKLDNEMRSLHPLTQGAGVPELYGEWESAMRAKQLIDGASFGPDALRAIGEAFDAAWDEIAGTSETIQMKWTLPD